MAAVASWPVRLVSTTAATDAVEQLLDVEGLDWLLAGGVLIVGVAASVLVRRGFVALVRRGTTSSSVAELLVGRLVQALVVAVAVVYALGVLGVRLGPLLGALGIGGVAIALALQPTMENLFAGVVLHAQRPLRIGEEVVTGDVKGVVIDITSRSVALQRRSGEIVYVPNSVVLGREIENLVRHGQRRTTLTVGVAYGTDLARALDVVRTAASGCPAVLPEPPVDVFVHGFEDSAVALDVDVWHGPLDGDRRAATSQVVVAVHAALRDAGITIPFPQRTVWSGDGADPRGAT